MNLLRFAFFGVRQVFRGSWQYFVWVGFLLLLVLIGILGYLEQHRVGHIASNMRDQVPWGLFIGTYAFYVGVAAAAIALVIPGYIYDWRPIKKIVIFGEMLAISSVVMCLLFVMADLGHPERFWHMLPFVGILNLRGSLMGWNVLILNSYLMLNLLIVVYFLYRLFLGRPYHKGFVMGLMLLSVPLAVGVHSTTAFIFNVLPARPYWNAAILVPRFLVTALCSGPALLLLIFYVFRHFTKLSIEERAIQKIAEVMAYVIPINILLFLAEVVKEYASSTEHLVHMKHYFGGLTFYATLAPICNAIALVIFLIPRLRRNMHTLLMGCVAILIAVYVEKGIGLVLPGYTPTPVGEIYRYVPSRVEWMIWLGISGFGALLFTLMSKMALPLLLENAKQQENQSQANVPTG